ncbi:carbohydrate ABC transporter permease [Microbacterium rhizomatis]|uniref:Carbohydrate ABC transporter permease n=1 Tax=Microbacterium rhizomatis TaxID=1631477 RepID=A0A5J5J4C8_9MICO|nr:carbohydrate ABC transporter permease [Microbacterium rhizomatis]KAA9108108.1 carbohydrate ABC transporter permease [Microbacterium rhizomatis]
MMTDTSTTLTAAPGARRFADRARALLSTGMVRIVLVALAAGTFAPVAFMIFKSLTKQDGTNALTFTAWAAVLSGQLPQAGLISLTVSLVAIVVILSIGTLAAFGFAKLRFRGSQTIMAIIVVLMLVPGQTFIITEYFNFSSLGLIGNLPAVGVLYGVTQLPFAIFIFTNFFRAIPDELVEAAIIDGASYPRAFWSIFLPLARPAMVTVGVLAFIGVWNDLLVALLFLPTPGQRTLSVVMAGAQDTRVFDVSQVMAGALLSAIPCIIVYLIFQKQIAIGLTAGTGK